MLKDKQIRSQVRGFLVPVFTETAPDGRRLNGLDRESFDMVRSGFACAECLAMFDMYTVTCPICGWTRDVQRDIEEAPDLWVQHIRERNEPWIAQDKLKPLNPFAAIQAVKHDKDVEQIPLSKLRERKRKRG